MRHSPLNAALNCNRGRCVIKVDIYDVFIGESAFGNPCAVLELNDWLPESELSQITRDVGLPVTSFITKIEGQFHIRWFALDGEINLCGHGSLGAGAAIISKYQLDNVVFNSKHGEVVITKKNDLYTLVLPSWEGIACPVPEEISDVAAGSIDVFSTRDLVLVFPTVEMVLSFQPDDDRFRKLNEYHALIVTAPDGKSGYVLRYFAPKIGISEDLATGSAQCSLAPYWFKILGSDSLTVRQLSTSGGYFEVERNANSLITVLAQAKLREIA
ncbi:PhzF family phenazine biosynthesis protein, partial [Vibrio vulnificus]|nr:PhzF family phenazine biosynthesis protein [Vibrio vulnificus]EIF3197472.1 PhzF family phenazine biosynthesis protein [Vibrio vulnificus]MCU8190608.1 PhzF family phenazine biosynthesis protein [Vibrio vulnificus]MCU8199289.1 PhzF family phenazine biosynthesis protein [Vibrio vulnificus]MCU8313492.1 PhzF family phenazine biosynthesis protein [Vibrio vulnificus]